MTQSELYSYARRLVNANSTDYPEADLVVDLNDALSDVWARIKSARGMMEFDDTNYTDLPAATFTISASTPNYKITQDEGSNEVITVHKVLVQDSDGKWKDVPRKQINEGNQDGLLDDSSDTATVPSFYYEMGATIYFSPIPSAATTGKVWFDRVPKYFVSGGSMTPGVSSLYHKLIGEKAALTYAIQKGLNSAGNINRLIEMGEERLEEYESSRRDDENTRLIADSIDAR